MRIWRAALLLASASALAGASVQEKHAADTDARWQEALRTAAYLERRGAYEASVTALTAALREAGEFGSQGPRAAITWNNLGGVYMDMGRPDDAAAAYNRALRMWQALGEFGRPHLLRCANNLLSLYLQTGDLRKAETIWDEVLGPAVRSAALQDPANLALARINEGNLELARKHYAASVECLTRAIALLERRPERDSYTLAMALDSRALARSLLKDYEQSDRDARRAIALLESALGPQHPQLARYYSVAADLARSAGHPGEAEQHYRKALEIAESASLPDRPLIHRLLERYADLLRSQHRKSEARQLRRRAAAMEAAGLPSSARQTVDVNELSGFKKPERP